MSSDPNMFKTEVTYKEPSDQTVNEIDRALEEYAKELEDKYAYVDQLIESICSNELAPELGDIEFKQAMLKELMALNYNTSICRTLLGVQIGLLVNAKKPEDLDND